MAAFSLSQFDACLQVLELEELEFTCIGINKVCKLNDIHRILFAIMQQAVASNMQNGGQFDKTNDQSGFRPGLTWVSEADYYN